MFFKYGTHNKKVLPANKQLSFTPFGISLTSTLERAGSRTSSSSSSSKDEGPEKDEEFFLSKNKSNNLIRLAPVRSPKRKKTSDNLLEPVETFNLTVKKKFESVPMQKAILSIITPPNQQSVDELEKEAKSLTNSIDISNFYDYTKNCMNIIAEIEKLENKATKPKTINIPKEYTPQGKQKKIAVFDLDETLFHCEVKKYNSDAKVIDIKMPSGQTTKIGVYIRPNWKEAIEKIKEFYIIVVYTASHQSYADSVLNFMDPENNYFKYRLYRHNCLTIKHNQKDFYIKDMTIFEGYSLQDVVIIDNSVLSFAFHLDNGIPILPYYNAKEDNELLLCAVYLETLSNYDDVRELNRKYLKLNEYLKTAKGDKISDDDMSDEDSKKTENIPMFTRRRKERSKNHLYYFKFKRNWEMFIKNCSKMVK